MVLSQSFLSNASTMQRFKIYIENRINKLSMKRIKGEYMFSF